MRSEIPISQDDDQAKDGRALELTGSPSSPFLSVPPHLLHRPPLLLLVRQSLRRIIELEADFLLQAYQNSASFVPKLAGKVIEWLDVQEDDLILDVGCGGEFTL